MATKVPSKAVSKSADKAHLHTDANIQNFAPVARIMKSALPENAKIAKEAKECMQECVSEFISFITSEGVCNSTCSCELCVESVLLTWTTSLGEMPARETQDRERRRYPLRHDLVRI